MVNNCTSACTFTDVNLQESLALLTMLRTRLHVKETINILNVFFLSRSEKVRQIFVLFIYISLYCVTNENLCCNVLEDTLAEAEFRGAITILEDSGFGKVCSLRIPRTANLVTVFVKKDPDFITWPNNLCTQAEFRQRYHLSSHRSITHVIKT